MKLYIHTDIEGVAGMVHFERREDDSHWNWDIVKRMHRLLTGEVNAAIEAALANLVLSDLAHHLPPYCLW